MKIKLVIWDLDDTLWAGTLAEKDEIRVFPFRADVVRQLNRHGIVSKNDYDQAEQQLKKIYLWDEFVFRRIAFVPKGEAISKLIKDAQLQPKHVIFVDDNHVNLQEVKYMIPEINFLDASSADCDRVLQEIITENKDIRKSRLEEYRILDQKISDQESSNLPRDEFLKSINLSVCVPGRMDNIDFATRIEELINRSNQLNFTKSRVPDGSMVDYISDIMRTECYSIFAWDKYGHHGLVGFAAVEHQVRLKHFTFSCRVMHMGVEEWLLAKLVAMYPKLDVSAIPLVPAKAEWINEKNFHDKEVRGYILEKHSPRNPDDIKLRVMANCQSAAFVHFGGLGNVADFDNAPRFFQLLNVIDDKHLKDEFPEYLAYGPFSDYLELYWPKEMRGQHFVEAFSANAEKFVDFVVKRGAKMLILLPPENAADNMYHHISRSRMKQLNDMWRGLAARHAEIETLSVSEFADSNELIADARHFQVPLLKKVGEKIGDWYLSRTSAQREPQAAA